MHSRIEMMLRHEDIVAYHGKGLLLSLQSKIEAVVEFVLDDDTQPHEAWGVLSNVWRSMMPSELSFLRGEGVYNMDNFRAYIFNDPNIRAILELTS